MAFQAILLIFIFVSTSFAKGCVETSYINACNYCQFDVYGKIDKSCYNSKIYEATTCISMNYPIMAGKYAKNECPELMACMSQLRSCVINYSTTNDKEDCQEGIIRYCYADADKCIENAALKCNEIEKQCPGSEALMILTGLGVFSASRKR